MIEIKNLSKSFGTKVVLEDVSLTINDGQIFGIVGINGAGKSTLLRLISGVFKADKGKILVDNEDVFDNPKAKSKIFFLPDEPYYDRKTNIESILKEYQVFYDIDVKVYNELIASFSLPRNKLLVNFSKGMKRQVFISLALAISPKYLLLDEAFDGLDPLAREKVSKALLTLTKNGSTVIISSHSLKELSSLCVAYGLINQKKILFSHNQNAENEIYHKYQVGFKDILDKSIFDFEYLKIWKKKHVYEFLTKYNFEEFKDKITKFNPLFIDEINVAFEERFALEVEGENNYE